MLGGEPHNILVFNFETLSAIGLPGEFHSYITQPCCDDALLPSQDTFCEGQNA